MCSKQSLRSRNSKEVSCSKRSSYLLFTSPFYLFFFFFDLKRYKSIPSFLQDFNGTDKGINTYLDTFMKSCAAYCVVSYLLLIGDRHLDNLMVTTDGMPFLLLYPFSSSTDLFPSSLLYFPPSSPPSSPLFSHSCRSLLSH